MHKKFVDKYLYNPDGIGMLLTIEQALQQVVAAHKQDKLQDAERLYGMYDGGRWISISVTNV